MPKKRRRKQVKELDQGALFACEQVSLENLPAVTIYVRVDRIKGFPDSVAQIVRSPSHPEQFGQGASAGIIGPETLITELDEENVFPLLPEKVVSAIQLLQRNGVMSE